MTQLLVLILSTSVLEATRPTDLLLEEWHTWKVEHGKTYNRVLYGSGGGDEVGGGQEEEFRMKIWMENKARIERHNRVALKGLKTYTLAMNQFGDLLRHEFTGAVNGYMKKSDTNKTRLRGATFLPPAHLDSLPDQVDWREEGAVTPVKNQGVCGSCYSFAATGALEAMYHRKTGVLTALSEQNIIDCSQDFGNLGCGGGNADLVYQYIKENKGIDTEASYPYQDMDYQFPNIAAFMQHGCRYNPIFKGAADVGFVDIESGNEAALKSAVATVGPCSVAFDASGPDLQFYSGGIYRDEHCSTTNLDHAVLAIGYGKDLESGEEYWLVKNSWGTDWGEEGYFRIPRNQGNMCGIATDASYPLV